MFAEEPSEDRNVAEKVEIEGNVKGATATIPPLKDLILHSLTRPKSLADRLALHSALNIIEGRNLLWGDDVLAKLKEQSKKELRNAFAAILLYYEGEETEISQIIGEKEFCRLKACLKDREEGIESFAKFRCGSVLGKESGTLTPEEEKLYLSKQILPYRILKAGVMWPVGVEPTSREEYLSAEEFASVFGIDKKAYQNLPRWEKQRLKKENKLW